MIRIQQGNINEVADYWASEVYKYLTEQLSGQNQVFYENGTRTYFETRLKKYEFIYTDKTVSITGVSKNQKDKVWQWIKEFLGNKKNFIGNKRMCEKWLAWHKRYLTNQELKNVVNEMFVKIYNEVSSDTAYEIFERLQIRTCPYCNRHYTFTLNSVKGKFKTRPEFDHFYDKNTYPLLAVVFFNLVPSCRECNHGKRNNTCGINPYFDDFLSKFVLIKPDLDSNIAIKDRIMNANEIAKISKESDFSVDFIMNDGNNVSPDEMLNIETLGLRPLYNMHKDYIMEIVEKANAYGELTRNGIVDSFQGLFHSEADVFNLIFGRYLSTAQQANRPLSKLTSDILDLLDL